MERHRFHSICPYFAMFPETFVRRNVLAWSNRGDVVLDPFSGRGTTVFESLLNGRKALGCDTNPVAVCLSKANPPALPKIMHRLDALEAGFKKYKAFGAELKDEFFQLCFHEKTLKQLLYLKKLDWRKNSADCFIAALALGCLHGESHKTGLCLSNRMPRTISTKPAYSVRWWQARNCVPPERNAFAIFRECAQYRYSSDPPLRGRVVEGDVRRVSTMLRSYRERVKLVITSPPYLDITDYHEDQWLRLWFLGGPMKPISGQAKDDRHRRIDAYWQFLCEAWNGIAPLLQDKAQIVIRIGGTRLGEEELRSGLLKSLNSTGCKFKLAEASQSGIRNGHRRIFQAVPNNSSVEHDFRFVMV
jgi:hypothetical protein